jgi:hypothetical protein
MWLTLVGKFAKERPLFNSFPYNLLLVNLASILPPI